MMTLFEKANWIGLTKTKEVLEFEKEFGVEGKVISAVLWISGLGFFDGTINGKKLDEYYYKPQMSDYTSRLANGDPHLIDGVSKAYTYLTYDIASFLKEGENHLSVLLAPGYYQNEDRLYEPFLASYGDKVLKYVIKIQFEGKDDLVILSDPSTKVRRTNLTSGLYHGDRRDFSKAPEPYRLPTVLTGPQGEPIRQKAPFDVASKVVRPVKKERRADGSLFIDFGINHSGGLCFKIKGKKGQKITIGHAEILKSDGSLNYETSRYQEVDQDDHSIVLDQIDQISEYILSGAWDEIHPTFSWFCYRYVEIMGLDDAKIEDLHSLFIHMDMPQKTNFSSSVPLFKELEEKAIRTIWDNSHAGLMTDCPHREKRPYTGDNNIIQETALYALESESFFDKWLDDIIRSQREDGFIPYTAPHLAGGGGLPWSYAVATVPDTLYRMTGKKQYVERSYESLKKWLGFCHSRLEPSGIIKDHGISWLWCLADWLCPQYVEFNVPYMSSACYFHSLDVASFFADILGKQEDRKTFEEEKEKLRIAMNEEFFDREKASYCRGIQGENALALAFGFYLPEYKEALKATIRKTYIENGCHFDTGMVMTPILLDALFQNGMADLAIKMLLKEDYPSYRLLLENETTVPETWSKHPLNFVFEDKNIIDATGELSHCHPMFGAALGKIYRYVAGMDLTHIYEGRIIFDPKAIDYLEHAELTLNLPQGKAGISWRKTKGKAEVSLLVPKGLKGLYQGKELAAGSYIFNQKPLI